MTAFDLRSIQRKRKRSNGYFYMSSFVHYFNSHMVSRSALKAVKPKVEISNGDYNVLTL